MSAFEQIAELPLSAAIPLEDVKKEATRTRGPPLTQLTLREHFAAGHLNLSTTYDAVKYGKFASIVLTAATEVLELRGDEAMRLLNSLQKWLDKTPVDHNRRRPILYLFIKLASESGQFPSALFITGVERYRDRDVIPGGYADIYQGVHEDKACAVKFLRIHPDQRADFNKILAREAVLWRQLHHPHILSFTGLFRERSGTSELLCMVSPWMHKGTLTSFVRGKEYNAATDQLRLLREVADGLDYLHSQKITHADLKSSNVLIDSHSRARLADFGITVVGDYTVGRMTTQPCLQGSDPWTAPEYFQENLPRPAPSRDVYAFGCLAYSMCIGKGPWHEAKNNGYIVARVLKSMRPARPTTEQCIGCYEISDALWDLIERCWHQDALRRPMISQIVVELRDWQHLQSPLPSPEDGDFEEAPSLASDEMNSALLTSTFNTPAQLAQFDDHLPQLVDRDLPPLTDGNEADWTQSSELLEELLTDTRPSVTSPRRRASSEASGVSRSLHSSPSFMPIWSLYAPHSPQALIRQMGSPESMSVDMEALDLSDSPASTPRAIPPHAGRHFVAQAEEMLLMRDSATAHNASSKNGDFDFL